jgi:beta-aspartyl-peptidase (threonine type)
MPTTDWSIVLHGGCADTNPDLDHQNDVRRQLRTIIGIASISAREGKRAKDIVVEIVAALEDCPLFNAGRGAVLTKDGAHEVRLSTGPGLASTMYTEVDSIDCVA